MLQRYHSSENFSRNLRAATLTAYASQLVTIAEFHDLGSIVSICHTEVTASKHHCHAGSRDL